MDPDVMARRKLRDPTAVLQLRTLRLNRLVKKLAANISADSGSATVPYYVAPGETFTVPANRQAVYAMDIMNDGTLAVDGLLIKVPALP